MRDRTYVDWLVGDGIKSHCIESVERVDMFRAKVGMNTLGAYIEEMQVEYDVGLKDV